MVSSQICLTWQFSFLGSCWGSSYWQTSIGQTRQTAGRDVEMREGCVTVSIWVATIWVAYQSCGQGVDHRGNRDNMGSWDLWDLMDRSRLLQINQFPSFSCSKCS